MSVGPVSVGQSGWVVLASATTGSDGAGLIAFAVVAALFVACWFLYRSLRRHLGRIDVDRTPSSRPDPGAVDREAPPT